MFCPTLLKLTSFLKWPLDLDVDFLVVHEDGRSRLGRPFDDVELPADAERRLQRRAAAASCRSLADDGRLLPLPLTRKRRNGENGPTSPSGADRGDAPVEDPFGRRPWPSPAIFVRRELISSVEKSRERDTCS